MLGREPVIDFDRPRFGDVPILSPWLLNRPERLAESLGDLLEATIFAKMAQDSQPLDGGSGPPPPAGRPSRRAIPNERQLRSMTRSHTAAFGQHFADSPIHRLLEIDQAGPGSPTSIALGRAMALGLALGENDLRNVGPNRITPATHGAIFLAWFGYAPPDPAAGDKLLLGFHLEEHVTDLFMGEQPGEPRVLSDSWFVFVVNLGCWFRKQRQRAKLCNADLDQLASDFSDLYPDLPRPRQSTTTEPHTGRPPRDTPVTEHRDSGLPIEQQSVAAELAQLSELHTQGLLTDHEFEEAKRQVLGMS